MMRVLSAPILWLLAAGCAASSTPDSEIRDVRPTKIESRIRVLVEGKGFEAGQPAEVVFKGTFVRRGGQAEVAEIKVAARAVAENRVVFDVDEAFERRAGRADFSGVVAVVQGNKAFASPPRAPFELEFFPPTLRKRAYDFVRSRNTNRVLDWLGIELEAAEGGLAVVRDTGLAAQAGLRAGDRIVSASGRPVAAIEDFARRWQEDVPSVTIGVLRGNDEMSMVLPGEGAPRGIPEGLLLVLLPVLACVLLLCLLGPFSGLVVVAERRIAGRMQSRIGPNRVGPQGLLQWLADGLKLILKEDVIPRDCDPVLFRLSPYFVWIGIFATFVVLPFSQAVIVADMNVGLLYLISITALVVVGIIMGGWASNSKWSLLGGMRSAAQIVSYEIPAALALLNVVLLAGTLSPQAIVRAQGGAPWSWFLFDSPFTFAAFFIYFMSALAEGNRTPFDLPEAESELVSGYNTEYSGFRFAAFFLSEWTNLYVIAAVATAVFLGGWRLPLVSPQEMEASILLQIAGFAVFFVKALALVFVIIWVRWTVPRFRVDQMMALCWKYLIPLTFAAFIGTALWVWLLPDWARLGSRYVMFAVGGAGLTVLFVKRVLYNLGNARRRLWDISGVLTPHR